MVPWWGWLIIAVAAVFTVSAGVMLVILINFFREEKKGFGVRQNVNGPLWTYERTTERTDPYRVPRTPRGSGR